MVQPNLSNVFFLDKEQKKRSVSYLPTEPENSGSVNSQQTYHNDPKFSDRYAWVNSADPD